MKRIPFELIGLVGWSYCLGLDTWPESYVEEIVEGALLFIAIGATIAHYVSRESEIEHYRNLSGLVLGWLQLERPEHSIEMIPGPDEGA